MMKKAVLLGLVAGAVAIAAVPAVNGAPASTLTSSTRFPIDLIVFVPCANGGAGETVQLTGYLHDLFHVTADGAGGFHVVTSDNPQGIRGTGSVTGAKYQGTGVTRSSLNVTAGVTNTYVNNFRIVGQGPGNNFVVHENFHVTVNANGDVTADHDNFNVDCG